MYNANNLLSPIKRYFLRALFAQRLGYFISTSIAPGFVIVLSAVDANEHMSKGKLAKSLTELGLTEYQIHKVNESCPASYFRGRQQICSVLSCSTITPISVSVYPFHLGVGDYRE